MPVGLQTWCTVCCSSDCIKDVTSGRLAEHNQLKAFLHSACSPEVAVDAVCGSTLDLCSWCVPMPLIPAGKHGFSITLSTRSHEVKLRRQAHALVGR